MLMRKSRKIRTTRNIRKATIPLGKNTGRKVGRKLARSMRPPMELT